MDPACISYSHDRIIRDMKASITANLLISLLFAQNVPSAIEGTVLWLDASDPDGNHVPGGTFGPSHTWVDKSAGGTAHFEQSDTDRLPQLVADGLNGLTVVRFDGGDFMDVVDAGKSILNGVPGATLFGLLKTNSTSGQRALMVSTGAGDGSTRAGLNLFDNFGINIAGTGDFGVAGRREDSDEFQRIEGGTVELDTFYQYTAVLDYENGSASLYAGGELLTTTDFFQTAGITSDTDSVNIRVGADAANNNLRGFFAGDIAEFIVYNKALSDSERQSIEAYLRDKWLPAPEPAPHLLGIATIGTIALLARLRRPSRVSR